jgi:hypothetical protein
MSHPQPKTPDHCNNATAVGIANNTIKRQRLRSMEMRFFWIGDKIAQQMYDIKWHPRQENLANYQSKHHNGLHHTVVRPRYLHLENSPWVLPRAKHPSALKGCVGIRNDGYIRKVPLLQAPRIQHASQSPVETAQNVPVHFGSKVRHIQDHPKCTSTFWVKSETRQK